MFFFVFLINRRPPRSTLFPNTTLFRSQKRTMADMRSVGTAVESYAVDNNVYPVAATAAVLKGLVEPRSVETTSVLHSLTNNVFRLLLEKQYTISSNGNDGDTTTCAAAT